MKKVLIVDDEKELLELVATGLAHDFLVSTVSTGKEALEKLDEDPDIVAIIADKDKPREGSEELEEVGIRLLETVRKEHPTVKRILMSGRLPSPLMDKTLVHAFWAKPFLLSTSVLQLGKILG